MTIPPSAESYTQISVLGENLDIRWLPEELMAGNYGLCNTELKQIHLKANQTGIQCLDTFIHELTHYISDRCNLELTEHQVHLLAMAWAQIYQANPELLGFIAERTTEEDERRNTRV